MTAILKQYERSRALAFAYAPGKMVGPSIRFRSQGEFGPDPGRNSLVVQRQTGVWTQITVDPEAGLVYLPVDSPTLLYGGSARATTCLASRGGGRLKTGRPQIGIPVGPCGCGITTCRGAAANGRDVEAKPRKVRGGARANRACGGGGGGL